MSNSTVSPPTGPIASWTCPFCNHGAVIRDDDRHVINGDFWHPLIREETIGYKMRVIFCPNPDCKRFTLNLELSGLRETSAHRRERGKIADWQLIPESAARVFPNYIPKPILDDYREACLIVSLSAKASATLARRCLQGMIRDFWKIHEPTLKQEIDALEHKVDVETWKAIDSLRQIGNIGAHMKADINVIVDVDPNEAELLTSLIETLLTDWYIARHDREQRIAKIQAIAAAKQVI